MLRRNCARSWAAVLLLIFWTRFPGHALPHPAASNDSRSGPTNCYSEEEVRTLIEGVMEAAEEEIERSAAEAVKATVLIYLPEAEEAKRNAQAWETECKRIKAEAFKGKVITGVGAFSLGLCLGAAAAFITGAGR